MYVCIDVFESERGLVIIFTIFFSNEFGTGGILQRAMDFDNLTIFKGFKVHFLVERIAKASPAKDEWDVVFSDSAIMKKRHGLLRHCIYTPATSRNTIWYHENIQVHEEIVYFARCLEKKKKILGFIIFLLSDQEVVAIYHC